MTKKTPGSKRQQRKQLRWAKRRVNRIVKGVLHPKTTGKVVRILAENGLVIRGN